MSQYYNTPEEVSDIQGYINKINAAGGKPIVVQALWDGDTQGWMLDLSVVIDTRTWFQKILQKEPIYKDIYLCYIRFGSDFRLFQGEEAWDEAIVGKQICEILGQHYNIPFWFPSPIHPDSDCPSWFDRHKAINCADCQKLIIPPSPPYVPREVCFRCHLDREKKADFISDEKEHFSMQLCKISPEAPVDDYSSYTEIDGSFGNGRIDNIDLYNNLKSILTQKEDITDMTNLLVYLYENDIKNYYDVYEKKFYEYELPRYRDIFEKGKVVYDQDRFIIKKEFAGHTYDLHRFIHRGFMNCVDNMQMLQEVLDNKEYLLVFFRHTTQKMDLFMYFIRNIEQKTVENVIKHFAELSIEDQKTRVALTEEQSRNVLQRLVDMGYIEIDFAQTIRITFKGMFY